MPWGAAERRFEPSPAFQGRQPRLALSSVAERRLSSRVALRRILIVPTCGGLEWPPQATTGQSRSYERGCQETTSPPQESLVLPAMGRAYRLLLFYSPRSWGLRPRLILNALSALASVHSRDLRAEVLAAVHTRIFRAEGPPNSSPGQRPGNLAKPRNQGL